MTPSGSNAFKVNLTVSWSVVTPICLNFWCINLYPKHELDELISLFILRITTFKSSLFLLRNKPSLLRYLWSWRREISSPWCNERKARISWYENPEEKIFLIITSLLRKFACSILNTESKRKTDRRNIRLNFERNNSQIIQCISISLITCANYYKLPSTFREVEFSSRWSTFTCTPPQNFLSQAFQFCSLTFYLFKWSGFE